MFSVVPKICENLCHLWSKNPIKIRLSHLHKIFPYAARSSDACPIWNRRRGLLAPSGTKTFTGEDAIWVLYDPENPYPEELEKGEITNNAMPARFPSVNIIGNQKFDVLRGAVRCLPKRALTRIAPVMKRYCSPAASKTTNHTTPRFR